MGLVVSQVWGRVFGRIETKILMVGLDAVGKTTILYKLRLGEVSTTIPTIGFNVEELKHNGSKLVNFTAWDVGGRDKIRALWRHYYRNTNALVFVVDSNDGERIEEAKDQLHIMLCEDELKDVPLLVFANKQDLPGAMPTAALCEKLGLNQLRQRLWYIQASSAITGHGLFEGLDWLTSTVSRLATDKVEPLLTEQEQRKQGTYVAMKMLPVADEENDASGSVADTGSTVDTDDFVDGRLEMPAM